MSKDFSLTPFVVIRPPFLHSDRTIVWFHGYIFVLWKKNLFLTQGHDPAIRRLPHSRYPIVKLCFLLFPATLWSLHSSSMTSLCFEQSCRLLMQTWNQSHICLQKPRLTQVLLKKKKIIRIGNVFEIIMLRWSK